MAFRGEGLREPSRDLVVAYEERIYTAEIAADELVAFSFPSLWSDATEAPDQSDPSQTCLSSRGMIILPEAETWPCTRCRRRAAERLRSPPDVVVVPSMSMIEIEPPVIPPSIH